MKIFSSDKIRMIDRLTAERQNISSAALMQRAADACVQEITQYLEHGKTNFIFCGMGNNGGDGIAIGYYLTLMRQDVKVIIVKHQERFSEDATKQLEVLKENKPESILYLNEKADLGQLDLSNAGMIIDCLFGTGLNKPVTGLAGDCVDLINTQKSRIISIDIPSGLYADRSSLENKHIVRCDHCLTFQFPKLAFLMPENGKWVPDFTIVDIQLDNTAITEMSTGNYYVTPEEIRGLLSPRNRFSHKGNYGHALLVAGSKGKSGAAVLAAKACLRSGAGLLTVHSVAATLDALLPVLPEAMSVRDSHLNHISEIETDNNYAALAFGPGVGTHEDTQLVLKKILNYYPGKLVIDADGLNILSENRTWLSFLPPSCILTPHPKEFERLTEKCTDDFTRLQLLKQFSIKHNCIVILKNAYTAIAMPDGNIFFNSTGNPGLAKGGSGDALTGIILGLLTRGYNAPKAALIGTYVHGLAADLCIKGRSSESILASDVIEMLPEAFYKMEASGKPHAGNN